MNIKNYIHKLQQKPVHERKRIAVIATAVGFSIILAIWVVSFNEMNKPAETQIDPASASLNDLKDNFQDNFQMGKDSIQNMMQELPNQTLPAGEAGGTAGTDNSAGIVLPAPDATLQNPSNGLDNNSNNQNNQDKPSVPQLP